MAKFVLQDRKRAVKVLEVEIHKKTYKIPLASTLSIKTVKSLNTPEGTMAFMEQYIPTEVVDELTQEEFNDIVNAWSEASNDDSGQTVGES